LDRTKFSYLLINGNLGADFCTSQVSVILKDLSGWEFRQISKSAAPEQMPFRRGFTIHNLNQHFTLVTVAENFSQNSGVLSFE
jgi:hypothetical protein